ncbi:Peroxidasin [Armadillidium vulgare]|nr:Peroxidasin [Armadillidium vulgare]
MFYYAQINRFTIRAEHVLNVLSQHSVTNTIIKDTCPSSPPCAGNYRYRTFDGSCNNLLHRDWGTTGTYFRRLIYPYYADGFQFLVKLFLVIFFHRQDESHQNSYRKTESE